MVSFPPSVRTIQIGFSLSTWPKVSPFVGLFGPTQKLLLTHVLQCESTKISARKIWHANRNRFLSAKCVCILRIQQDRSWAFFLFFGGRRVFLRGVRSGCEQDMFREPRARFGASRGRVRFLDILAHQMGLQAYIYIYIFKCRRVSRQDARSRYLTRLKGRFFFFSFVYRKSLQKKLFCPSIWFLFLKILPKYRSKQKGPDASKNDP